MSKEALATGHELKTLFLRAYIADGSYRKKPKLLSPNEWSMQRKVGFQYALTDKTLGEIGMQYGFTKENARQLNRNFLDNACKTSSPQLQVQYPRTIIPDAKPRGQKSRERHSKAKGGLSLKAKELTEKGITDPKRIKDTLNISYNKLCHVRKTLKQWGIDIPRTRKPTIKKRHLDE